MSWAFLLVAFALAFLLGSIPSGVLIGRAFFRTDIREVGSGNIGTTNALRALGKRGGAAVFAIDFGKGLLAGFLATVLLAAAEGGAAGGGLARTTFLAAAFAGCIWGHIFSPWLGFHGGKGIAVAVGCLFFTFGPVGALIELAAFAAVVALTRTVSAGSVTAAVLCPFLAIWFCWGDWLGWALCTAAALTVLWAHRGNIARLRAGEERTIGSSERRKAGRP